MKKQNTRLDLKIKYSWSSTDQYWIGSSLVCLLMIRIQGIGYTFVGKLKVR